MKKHLIILLFGFTTLYSFNVFGNTGDSEDSCFDTAWNKLYNNSSAITDYPALTENLDHEATLRAMYPWRFMEASSGEKLINLHIKTWNSYINCVKTQNTGNFSENDIKNIRDTEIYVQHLETEHDLLLALHSIRESEKETTTLAREMMPTDAILEANIDKDADKNTADLEDLLGDEDMPTKAMIDTHHIEEDTDKNTVDLEDLLGEE